MLDRSLFRITLGVLAVILAAVFGFPAIAGAATAASTSNVVLSVPWLTLAASTLIPLLVGYLTASSAPPALKGVLNIIFSAVTAAVSVLISSGGHWVTVDVVGAFAVSLLASQTAHQVLWKPTNATNALQRSGPQIGRLR